MSTGYQQNFFDEPEKRWRDVSVVCSADIEFLLKQIFVEAIKRQSVIQNKEEQHASQNKVEPFRENSISLSSSIDTSSSSRASGKSSCATST